MRARLSEQCGECCPKTSHLPSSSLPFIADEEIPHGLPRDSYIGTVPNIQTNKWRFVFFFFFPSSFVWEDLGLNRYVETCYLVSEGATSVCVYIF